MLAHWTCLPPQNTPVTKGQLCHPWAHLSPRHIPVTPGLTRGPSSGFFTKGNGKPWIPDQVRDDNIDDVKDEKTDGLRDDSTDGIRLGSIIQA